jgi:hypothetical protein
VTLPFIQCHHTRGFASSGGVRNDRSSDGRATVVSVRGVGVLGVALLGGALRGIGARAVGARGGVVRCASAWLAQTASTVMMRVSERRIEIMLASTEERAASDPRDRARTGADLSARQNIGVRSVQRRSGRVRLYRDVKAA